MQGRFPSCNTDSLQNIGTFFQKGQYVRHGEGMLCAAVQQIAVVAEGTPEVAAAQKNSGGHAAWIVEKSCFL